MGLDAINKIRQSKGITLEELANLSGVPIGTLSKIAAGITKDPKLETVKAIAKALECTLDDLDDSFSRKLTTHQQKVIDAYIKHPEMQSAVDKLLGIDSDSAPTQTPKHSLAVDNVAEYPGLTDPLAPPKEKHQIIVAAKGVAPKVKEYTDEQWEEIMIAQQELDEKLAEKEKNKNW